MTDGRIIAVFGGTGFLGQRVVRHLGDRGFSVRAVCRHPSRGATIFGDHPSAPQVVRADIADDRSVRAAVARAFGVVNAVSLYVERGAQTFRSVHVEAAARLARHAREAGVSRLIHVSGIGADARSRSSYIRARGEGEDAVRAAFPSATIVRPAVMFGADDSFLSPLTRLMPSLPLLPLFGRGETRLQPAYVEDVGEAIARILDAPGVDRPYELGGPRITTYRDLLQAIGDRIGAHPVLLPVPFPAWTMLGFAAEMLSSPLITRNQVELMEIDTVASPDCPGFRDLGIEPQDIDVAL
jgi:NADH dehydrogenase